MDDDAVFAAQADRRRAVADLLDSLDDKQLATPSLCAGWTVKAVAAHLVAAAATSAVSFLAAMVRSGFRPHVANTQRARKLARRPAAELSRALREHAGHRMHPPGIGAVGPMTDLLVHEGDMRLPLGLPFDPPLPLVAEALGFLSGRAPGFVPKGRLAGIKLVPTDLDRTWGSGAELTGRAADLMMAVCGRPAVLPSLTGPGAPILATRLTP
ncbi:maleylpyruvate isomerase family mycothiol-dependent enzyme [Labedaea rhizosphaerae]|uniref:Uncharacterized protein (TIGR03083 family) n=1 Tax=Labedaea rhizosphaerae TaxID=598644 RepID=A0A4R6RY99_LABRH|nr:maleylpyruvate isomerase family mycothiol-dependent enzyme [Labedaea rhizosphaerae]TDP92080.1 uncharacterized protein (TIGR03083 family) [Labedaea rhizosphaerae]